MPACSNTTKDFSLVLMGSMDLVKVIKYKNACYWKNLLSVVVAYTIEDAAKVLCTKFESSGTSTLVATEG